jgi:methylase of polypeptide subunit release factors
VAGDAHTDRFESRYRITGDEVFLEIERAVLGVAYQATGYTTGAEADELGRRLGLGPGSRLLDLGAGCGYPGVHLAAGTGCSVVSIDPVASGAAAALARAEHDGLAERHLAVIGRGQQLPVRPGSVDAVVHVDVIC